LNEKPLHEKPYADDDGLPFIFVSLKEAGEYIKKMGDKPYKFHIDPLCRG